MWLYLKRKKKIFTDQSDCHILKIRLISWKIEESVSFHCMQRIIVIGMMSINPFTSFNWDSTFLFVIICVCAAAAVVFVVAVVVCIYDRKKYIAMNFD